MTRSTNIHPFPARMSPELALGKTKTLREESVVLDPMSGSGTVIRAASQNGHKCIAFDVDPLAVLMTKVATGRLDEERFDKLATRLLEHAAPLKMSDINLPWFDRETMLFTNYWFAPAQHRDLRRLAHVLHNSPSLSDDSLEANALRIALSRLIITKESGASLARDVSHSRPHRVVDENDFDVLAQLEKSAKKVKDRIVELNKGQRATVRVGDARKLPWIRDQSIDMVMTSPPYLNAIDYMRGHRLSLVWLGHSLSQLRNIRSNSIGAERGPDAAELSNEAKKIRTALGKVNKLPTRYQDMIDRYSIDLLLMLRQSSRVLKNGGKAVFVVGNSCLKDIFISNARGLEAAATLVDLKLTDESERDLPVGSRYLPMPEDKDSALGRRMRTEAVLTFVRRNRKAA